MDACPLPVSESTSIPINDDSDDGQNLQLQRFIPPQITKLAPSVVIEYCDRCRWLHRATWVSTELLLTFPPPALHGITLVPLNSADTAGRFRVWVHLCGHDEFGAPKKEGENEDETLTSKMTMVWDRKSEGGFPELKVLKQRIRDVVDPGKSLGHSDKPS